VPDKPVIWLGYEKNSAKIIAAAFPRGVYCVEGMKVAIFDQ